MRSGAFSASCTCTICGDYSWYSVRAEITLLPAGHAAALRDAANKIGAWAVFTKRIGSGERADVLEFEDQLRYEQLVLPHLNAAYNLARWLMRDSADAQDVTQEAMLRSYKFFAGFRGGDARAWLLRIVRNTCYSWREKISHEGEKTEFDEESHGHGVVTPETMALAGEDKARLTRAIESLSPRCREVLVLRELEGCSYKEIAAITSVPIGTVMSTLSRARESLRAALLRPAREEASHEV